MTDTIPGYTKGTPAVTPAPTSMAELAELCDVLLWTEDDSAALQRAREVLADQVEEILDLWYGYVGSKAPLVATFAGPGGDPDPHYLAAVRARFGRWILDTCSPPYDQAWLDYAHEIGRRHARAAKGRTDGVESPSAVVPIRYVVALIFPITSTIRPFLAAKGDPPEQVEAMHVAWFKSVVLQVALWLRAYDLADW